MLHKAVKRPATPHRATWSPAPKTLTGHKRVQVRVTFRAVNRADCRPAIRSTLIVGGALLRPGSRKVELIEFAP